MSYKANDVGLTINWNDSTPAKKLAAAEKKVAVAMMMYMNTKASEVEAYMKLNRPWTDRTNMAKATLNTKVSQPDENTIRMTLAHGVDYGIWLELAHSKNYAIIGPTLNIKGPEVIQGMSGLISKIIV